MDVALLKDQLAKGLNGDYAHMTFEEAIANFPEKAMNIVVPHSDYTPWRLLEHIRITQADMVTFIKPGEYTEKSWPQDYWPDKNTQATLEMWNKTVAGFISDRDWLVELVSNTSSDLTAPLVHRGEDYTLLRQVRILLNHNAYHIGEFAIMRSFMNTWGKDHE